MTNDASFAGSAQYQSGDGGAPGGDSALEGRIELLPAPPGEPVVVRASGDIDLTNVGEFQAALDEAAAVSSAVTADLAAVTYCDSATIRALIIAARRGRLTIKVSASGALNTTLLKVSGLDQIATVVILD